MTKQNITIRQIALILLSLLMIFGESVTIGSLNNSSNYKRIWYNIVGYNATSGTWYGLTTVVKANPVTQPIRQFSVKEREP